MMHTKDYRSRAIGAVAGGMAHFHGAGMIEPLESRTFLSGNVWVKLVNDTLFIRGDEQPNQITIQRDGRYVRVSIDFFTGTAINQNFGTRKFLNFDGTLNVNLGGGDDRLRVHNLNLGGDLIIRTADGDDGVTIADSTVGGKVDVLTGRGADRLNLINTTVAGSSKIRTGADADIIGLNDSTFAGPVLVRAGSGTDTINHAGAVFNSTVHLDGDSGRDLLSGEAIVVDADFRGGDNGWTADVSDYGPTQRAFSAGLRPLPAELGVDGDGFWISGFNLSDSQFMFLKRRLGPEQGVNRGQWYQLVYAITFASSVPKGIDGAGGSPGDSVVMKAGASAIEPTPVTDEFGNVRMNVDKGEQVNDGPAASLAGTIANDARRPPDFSWPDPWPYRLVTHRHVHRSLVRSSSDGKLWLLVGTESGFEGRTTLYYQRIRTMLLPVAATGNDQ